MTPNIRPRLFVLISSHYFGNESYIARGPLSLISHYSGSNVIYYDNSSDRDVFEKLMLPLTLYKFVKGGNPNIYYDKAIRAFRSQDFEPGIYVSYFHKERLRFLTAATLAGIVILSRPTFTELVRWLRLEPGEVSGGLRELFKSNSIKKTGGARYEAQNSFRDSILNPFSSSMLSKKRADLLAGA